MLWCCCRQKTASNWWRCVVEEETCQPRPPESYTGPFVRFLFWLEPNYSAFLPQCVPVFKGTIRWKKSHHLITQLPHRWIMKNLCLKSTLWELPFRTKLLTFWQTSAFLGFFAQAGDVIRNRLLTNSTNQLTLARGAASDPFKPSMFPYAWRWMHATF